MFSPQKGVFLCAIIELTIKVRRFFSSRGKVIILSVAIGRSQGQ